MLLKLNMPKTHERLRFSFLGGVGQALRIKIMKPGNFHKDNAGQECLKNARQNVYKENHTTRDL